MPARSEALLLGDLSGEFVHPALVHVVNLAGFSTWQEKHGAFSLSAEVELRSKAEEALILLEGEEEGARADWFVTRMHVYCIFAGYHLWGRRMDATRDYVGFAADLMNRVGIDVLVANFIAIPPAPARIKGRPQLEAFTLAEGSS
jgi:hypothetical protein